MKYLLTRFCISASVACDSDGFTLGDVVCQMCGYHRMKDQNLHAAVLNFYCVLAEYQENDVLLVKTIWCDFYMYACMLCDFIISVQNSIDAFSKQNKNAARRFACLARAAICVSDFVKVPPVPATRIML